TVDLRRWRASPSRTVSTSGSSGTGPGGQGGQGAVRVGGRLLLGDLLRGPGPATHDLVVEQDLRGEGPGVVRPLTLAPVLRHASTQPCGELLEGRLPVEARAQVGGDRQGVL